MLTELQSKFIYPLQLLQTPYSDQERHYQFIIRENMFGLAIPKCRAALLTELIAEMKKLKEELEDKKYGKWWDISWIQETVKMYEYIILNTLFSNNNLVFTLGFPLKIKKSNLWFMIFYWVYKRLFLVLLR